MSEIQGGRHDSLLRRIFPVKGPAIAPRVTPEITPIIVVQPFENHMRALLQDKVYGTSWSVAGAAGQFGCTQLENPSGSQTLCLVRLVTGSTAGADDMYIGFSATATALANNANSYPLDVRVHQGTTAKGVATVTYGTNAAVALNAFSLRRLSGANVEVVWDRFAVIPPGYYFKARLGTANTAWRGSLEWSELAANPAELNLGYG